MSVNNTERTETFCVKCRTRRASEHRLLCDRCLREVRQMSRDPREVFRAARSPEVDND